MNVSRKISREVSLRTSREGPGIYEDFIESSLGKRPGRIVFETFSKKSFVKMSRKTCIFP